MKLTVCSPGQEGPSYAPPSLPEGWIPQWDANSKKYYFVQISTGTSQYVEFPFSCPYIPREQFFQSPAVGVNRISRDYLNYEYTMPGNHANFFSQMGNSYSRCPNRSYTSSHPTRNGPPIRPARPAAGSRYRHECRRESVY